jgi:hypothetical protein
MKRHVAVFCIVALAASTASAQPNVDLKSWEDWMAALGIEVDPMSPAEWGNLPPEFTGPFGGGAFVPPELYGLDDPIPPWEGDPPDDDDDGGLVMPWGPDNVPGDGPIATGWKYEYDSGTGPLIEPGDSTDISGTAPKPKTTSPDPERGQKIDKLGVGFKDTFGKIRAWFWDFDESFAPGVLAWNDDFELRIDMAAMGAGSAFDAAYGPEGGSLMNGDVAFVDTGFDPDLSTTLLVATSGEMLPGGQAAPPDYPLPGGEDMMWMYFDELRIESGAPLFGDFDGDGDVDADDIDILCANMGGDPGIFDIDGDGDVDEDDFYEFIGHYPIIIPPDPGDPPFYGSFPGDFNLDGEVNGTDLSILSGGFGTVGGWADGNANCDSTINGTDLSILSANFGNAVTAAIPEPMTMSLLGLGGLAMLRRRQ